MALTAYTAAPDRNAGPCEPLMQTFLALVVGLVLVSAGLWDAFETVVLPRRVSRRVRIATLFYQLTWRPYAAVASHVRDETRRENYLSFYGPLSLILLVGVWAVVLVLGFAVLQWAAGPGLSVPDGQADFGIEVYFSGTSFFTLGLGDVIPHTGLTRALTVVEAGTGFGFLALVIGYLPIVYQMFARRETNVSLLDQRAGSPPSAAELLRRNVDQGDVTTLIQLLRDWEVWVADLLESHLSYPTLAYFRSQHENQSWGRARHPPGRLHLRRWPPCRRGPDQRFRREAARASHRATRSGGGPPPARDRHRTWIGRDSPG